MPDGRGMAGIVLAIAMFLAPILARAQDYPAKPVRLVTAEVGGGHDLAARLIAQGLSANLGQQFIVENRAGAILAGQTVAKAPPDGYTLLIFGSSLWLMPFMRSNVPYDVVRDFVPIGLEVNSPILLVVHPTLPVKSVKELIALAKAKPGALDYATGQPGASTHLASELFKAMAKVDMQRIPYKGNGPAMIGLIGGQVQLMFPTAGSAATHLKSGRVRALAITSAKPSALFPDLPTVAAAGLPGYECDSMIGAFAPAKLAPAIINLLSKEMAAAVNSPEIKQRFASSGVETIGSSPQVLAAAVKSEMARLGKLIKDIGLRDE
jgi:tripartite-type tricarboxylate transporter receptor subunit TctC